MEGRILEFMEQVDFRPLKAQDLAAEMKIEAENLADFFAALRRLETAGKLILTKKGRYGLCRHMNLIAGTVEGNQKGFAFLRSEEKKGKDIYIPSANLNGALHNDRVLVRKTKGSRYINGNDEGEVVRILHHANQQIVGTYEGGQGQFAFVRPDEKRLGQDIFIGKEDSLGAEDGDMVVVNIKKWPQGTRSPEGKIVEIIGKQSDKGADILKVIRKYQLPEEFSAKVLNYAEEVAKISERDLAKRRDLRGQQIITMDGADARDLDDAVSLRRRSNGNYLLGVHIADVGQYVAVGSPLDREAYRRGTSVYFPDRVIPMLPPTLSNGICSLHPEVERLTLSCEMEIDAAGKVVAYEIFEAVICSQARLTYDDVNAILEGDAELTAAYKDFTELFFNLDALRIILKQRREKRGALLFDFPEAKVILDSEGKPLAIKRRVQGRAEGIIEECMIVANETVAEAYYERDIPFIYRIHDRPSDDKVLDLKDVLAISGLSLGTNIEAVEPHSFQRLLAEIKDKPEAYLLQTVILRTMSHALYDTENRGHFGLASSCYCHFTSPIRRYPDLCIHRLIKDYIDTPYQSENKTAKLWKRLKEAANQSSLQERKAEEAEREATDMKMVQYMERHLGEEFEGIIAGTMSFGFFVELENTVNGLVHVSSLTDDYYEYHENSRMLMGKRTQIRFRLGDRVRIRVSRVNVEERLIDFELVTCLENEEKQDS